MNILNLCLRDYAGLAIRLTDAINQYTPHHARLLTNHPHRFDYPTDIQTTDLEVTKKWINWSDVIHCWPTYQRRHLCFIYAKKLIWTHIGTAFRKHRRQFRQATQFLKPRELVSTPDLVVSKRFTWLPNAVPVDEWFKMKTAHEGKPIVCQTPSGRAGKRTNEILGQIGDKENVNVHIIEDVPWRECMKLKSKADIYIGEFNLGYGMSQLEAMAMKIPVITHLEPLCEKRMRRQIGPLPHYDCPIETLSEGIDHLLSDKELYDHHAEQGFEYVKKFHDYPVVADKFISICEEL